MCCRKRTEPTDSSCNLAEGKLQRRVSDKEGSARHRSPKMKWFISLMAVKISKLFFFLFKGRDGDEAADVFLPLSAAKAHTSLGLAVSALIKKRGGVTRWCGPARCLWVADKNQGVDKAFRT